ncbi:hypothetical protein OG994_12685 [Micromonospora globbae]|uniref:ATP-binding protein n=1 Tax=Micromonospora globbae TaxID=1894969 RepID=A0ABZ1SDE2_9ACTN|nr:hypothetical protein [Micromonospora globbae]
MDRGTIQAMGIAWDPENKQLRDSDGRLFGRMSTVADLEVDRAFVEDVTLAEWHNLIQTTKLPNDNHLYLTIEGDGPEALLISKAMDGCLEIIMSAEAPEWKDKEGVEELLRTVFEVNRDKIGEVKYNDLYWDFHVCSQADHRTTREMFSLQEVCSHLLKLPERPRPVGSVKVDAVRQILLTGTPNALLGLHESTWLEVKSRGYDVESFAGKVELAQDVARFANGREAGLLVLGFRTTKRDGADTLTKVTPLQFPANAVGRYRNVLDSHIYPPIEGLAIDQVPVQGGYLMLIGIPLQSESSRPFLVHGAIVAGRNEGSFISIIERRGEGARSMSPAELHALLAAGRSVLRGRTI